MKSLKNITKETSLDKSEGAYLTFLDKECDQIISISVSQISAPAINYKGFFPDSMFFPFYQNDLILLLDFPAGRLRQSFLEHMTPYCVDGPDIFITSAQMSVMAKPPSCFTVGRSSFLFFSFASLNTELMFPKRFSP